ncbi:MAG: WxL domain-containing protein [Streptococcaceae bacterium]|nr:WxL domain-containing protein [Streptococcaceae bacterium]
MKKIFFILVLLFSLVFAVKASAAANAPVANSEGSIGFVGKYKSKSPAKETDKTQGTTKTASNQKYLPKTGEVKSSVNEEWGILLIFLALTLAKLNHSKINFLSRKDKLMKKMITLSSSLLATLTLASALSPVIAHAAVNDATPAGNYNSTGTVTFESDTDSVTPPVNPDNPDPTDPVNPENPDGSNPEVGGNGPLSIDFASSLSFGTQKISSSDKTYYAAPQKLADGSYVPDYVQVTDNRGSFAGWSLYVNWDGQFRRTGAQATSTAAGDVLTGAQLNFTSGVANNSNTAITPSATASYTLGDDTGASQQLVMNAVANKGMGTSVAKYGDVSDYDGTYTTNGTKSPITLTVPGSTVKAADTYTTNLTWTLSSTPDLG